MRLKIVKFKDGSYGIRKGIFKYRYLDLCSFNNHWWERTSKYYPDCKTNDYLKIYKIYLKFTDKGTPVGVSDKVN